MTKICAFSLAIVFALLGIISYTLKANPIAEIIIGAFSLILILAFLYRGVKYWERIVDTEKKRT
jgi:ABC-type Mn2+/Zn2+ transport system permease subunit